MLENNIGYIVALSELLHGLRNIGVRGGVGGDGRPPALKMFGANSVFRASASCSKILNDKKYFSIVKNFRANSVFQGKRKLLKVLNGKKYIIQYSGKFHGKLYFSGQGEKIFNAVYSASKGNYGKVSFLGEHNTQRTSPP